MRVINFCPMCLSVETGSNTTESDTTYKKPKDNKLKRKREEIEEDTLFEKVCRNTEMVCTILYRVTFAYPLCNIGTCERFSAVRAPSRRYE